MEILQKLQPQVLQRNGYEEIGGGSAAEDEEVFIAGNQERVQEPGYTYVP